MSSIDLTKINWNCLSPEEFQKINNDLLAEKKLAKSFERQESKVNGYEIVSIHGNLYEIKASEAIKLKKMRSEKSKQKLINKIVS